MGSTQQLYSLSWGEFSSSLSSTAQVLRGHGDLVDVTLSAGGKIFPAHKLVLGAASPLLMELLKSTRCEHPVVMLAGITAPDLEAILHFIYSGEVSVEPTRLPSLLQAAQCLDIQALSLSMLSVDKVSPVTSGTNEANNTNSVTSYATVRKRKVRINQKLKLQNNVLRSRQIENSEGKEIPAEIMGKETGSKKSHLSSELPVVCSICGATLRQSRNLRRHMELIHMKHENGINSMKKTKKPDIISEGLGITALADTSQVTENNGLMLNIPTRTTVAMDGRDDLNQHCSPVIPQASSKSQLDQQANQLQSFQGLDTAALCEPLHPLYNNGHLLAPVQHPLQQITQHHFRQSTIYQEHATQQNM